MIDDVSVLVELHLRFQRTSWGAERPCGATCATPDHLLEELNELTRCDCTSATRARPQNLPSAWSELEIRIAELREREDLERLRRPSMAWRDGTVLNIARVAAVGRALEFLMEIRLDEGEITPQEARLTSAEWRLKRNNSGRR